MTESVRTLVRGVREILGRNDLESENLRKAALRRLLHEHAAGLTPTEIEALLADLRKRFPNRDFERSKAAETLARRCAELEGEVADLRAMQGHLRLQVDHFQSLVTRAAAAVQSPDGPGTRSREKAREPVVTANTAAALAEITGLLFAFAIAQDETARSVEETLGCGPAKGASRPLAELLRPLFQGEPLDGAQLEAIRRRLRSLQLLPGALMTGAQQSWKGGTREILELLDPKAQKASILKSPAVLRQVEQRFVEFWNQFEPNVEHYYRGRFERAYRDKMEDGP
jgi:hypothetical protein